MHRMPIQLHRGADFRELPRAVTAGLVAIGIAAGLLSVGMSVQSRVASLLTTSAGSLATEPAAPSGVDGQALDALLQRATPSSRVDASGRWVAQGRVHAIDHSRAALELSAGEHTVVNLLGVRVYGLPVGATDLSMLAGAKVIMRGNCEARGSAWTACSVAGVQIVELGTGPVRADPDTSPKPPALEREVRRARAWSPTP
jgi:hypothetical protein